MCAETNTIKFDDDGDGLLFVSKWKKLIDLLEF